MAEACSVTYFSSNLMVNYMHVPCPTCRKLVLWEGNPSRPFCSDRCREHDLAAWASDSYRLPVKESQFDDLIEDDTTSRS